MKEEATLGAGCFWCVESVFKKLRGVQHVESGYAGGHASEPTYEQVCSGSTGHAEVIRIEFDSDIISFEKILEVFFRLHNPTTLNQQGADRGTQYRSVIFFHSDAQKEIAEKKKQEVEEAGYWADPIVTEITELSNYFKAEDYHQDYFTNNPDQSYCVATIPPKQQKLTELFPELLED